MAHELLRLATAGSVDDGKSTLVGRLLYDTKSILADTMDAIEQVSRDRGLAAPDLALLTDGLRAEREQGITIDVAYRYFSTPNRSFILADTPGHVQYTRNMVTGASTAELALILVDARNGVVEQTRRHAAISALLGVRHIAVVVNKMDLVGFDRDVFESIRAEFDAYARAHGVDDVVAIPISALDGDNVVTRSPRTDWYEGPTLLEHLESVPVGSDPARQPFRFPVQYVIRPQDAEHHDYRGYAGRVEAGTVSVGDAVVIAPSGARSTVVAIDTYDGPLAWAQASQSVTLRLADDIDISRGDLLAAAEAAPDVVRDVGCDGHGRRRAGPRSPAEAAAQGRFAHRPRVGREHRQPTRHRHPRGACGSRPSQPQRHRRGQDPPGRADRVRPLRRDPVHRGLPAHRRPDRGHRGCRDGPDDCRMTAAGAIGSDPAARYPLLLDLAGRATLVVGGGPVAARRAAGLVAAGAQVTVIAPAVCEDLADLAAEGRVSWWPREATAEDVTAGPAGVAGAGTGPEGDTAGAAAGSGSGARPDASRWWLVHTATGDQLVDQEIARRADDAGIWCVRADRAEESAAHTPAIAHGPDGVQVAVSGGGDPGRARAIRDAISDLLATGTLPLRRTRPATAPPGSRRVRGDRVRLSPTRSADAPSRPDAIRASGRVVLVGGGPGDPGLITVAGRQWLSRADVVVTDRLGPTSLLSELGADVTIIDVGKTAGNHPIPQDEINRILVEHARAGRTVVRLKGGDPFVLGRGGEEALHCLAHDVPVEVVPGVTSAVSVPAAAGIPVTHRGITTSLVIASAHAGAGQALDAARTAPQDATLVLLMGLSGTGRDSAGTDHIRARPGNTGRGHQRRVDPPAAHRDRDAGEHRTVTWKPPGFPGRS